MHAIDDPETAELVGELEKVKHLFSGTELHLFDVLRGKARRITRTPYHVADRTVRDLWGAVHPSADGYMFAWDTRKIRDWFRVNYTALTNA